MSEIPHISPLLDGMKPLEQFSDHGGTQCCYLEQIETGEQYVLKHISIPESEVKTQALILTGAVKDEEAANEYYESLAEDLRGELIRLQSFREHGGIAAWSGYQIEKKEGVGFDIYLLMPRKTSLSTHLQDKAMTHLQALNLGIDLCDALATLRESGYTYQNLKPENIFLDARGHFTIGDLGLMPADDLQYSAVPEDYLNLFSAPELSGLIPEPNKTSDIYALGMILYYVFNGNHLPFEDEKTPPEKAAAKRQDAQALPAPVYADYELAEIISVACSRDPADRYDSPEALRQALTLYMQRNEVSDQLLVPPLSTETQAEPPDIPQQTPEEAVPTEAPAPEEPEAALPEEPPLAESASEELPSEEPEPEPSAEAPEIPEEAPPEPSGPSQAPEAELESTEAESELPDPDSADAQTEDAREIPESIDELLASVNDVLNEEEPEPEAPDIEANEEAIRETPQKKKRRVWIPILIGLLVLAILGAVFAYFYTNWYLVTMEKLEVVDRTADSITVAYQLSSPDPDLSWDCIDTYGNGYPGTAGDSQVTFRGLEPGTQYTVRFIPGKLHKLLGETTATAATAAMTQIVSMTAALGPDKTIAEIALVVSGPEPEQWLLTYSSTGSDSGSLRFSGHSAEITGLKLNEIYLFELKTEEDVYLTGQTECSLTVTPDIQVSDFRVSAATADSLTVSWDSLADMPDSWTVQCTGGGYDQVREVTECTATFTGLQLKEAYTFQLSTPFSETPFTLTLPANSRIVTALSAEALESGVVKLEWTCTDPQPEKGWVVRYQVGSSSGSVSVPEENAAELPGLPPDAELSVTLEPAGGESVVGTRSCTVRTPAAADFSTHGFSSGDSSLSLYALPEGEDWTYDDLGDSLDAFDPEAEAAVVLQAPEGFDAYDTDETAITLVIRDGNGVVASYRTVSSTWNDIWRGGRYLTSCKLPVTAGDYQLELYFDSQFVCKTGFSVSA